ncbi:MAG: hypothetical protein JW863_18755 [Chitinispirillaceae bacterium]|nr:hypothetical protein [Chitinispirillaceae bacterium]
MNEHSIYLICTATALLAGILLYRHRARMFYAGMVTGVLLVATLVWAGRNWIE